MADAGSFRTLRTLREGGIADDAGWVARHLTRTKLGLALGAGGAKGFAHVGVIDVLERAGHAVDFVAGSSLGALVGALMGLRTDAGEVERQLRQIWSPDNVNLLPNLSPDGVSVGLERVLEAVKDTFRRSLDVGLGLPVSVVAADLEAGEPSHSATGRSTKPSERGSLSQDWHLLTGMAPDGLSTPCASRRFPRGSSATWAPTSWFP